MEIKELVFHLKRRLMVYNEHQFELFKQENSAFNNNYNYKPNEFLFLYFNISTHQSMHYITNMRERALVRSTLFCSKPNAFPCPLLFLLIEVSPYS